MNAIHHQVARSGANILDQSRIARRGRPWRRFLLIGSLFGGLAAVPAYAQQAAMPSVVAAKPTAAPNGAPPPVPAALAPGGGIVVGGEGSTNLYEARAVPVDVTGASVTEARERAFTDGRVAALHVVLERIVAQNDLARVPALAPNDVIDMVQEFSIANERTSAVRYLADLTVRFNDEAVRRMLRNAHVPFSEAVSRPLVVLPVYAESASSSPVLWDANNPWREAFAHLGPTNGLVPLILPAGDAQDAHLKMDQVNSRDATALGLLAFRYNAGGVVIAKATGGAPGSDAVQLVLTEVRGISPPVDTVMSSAVAAGQSREDILSAAAATVTDAISDNWKRQGHLDAKESVQITALASLTDLKDWLQIKQSLRNVPLVDNLELAAMTRDRAQLSFRYRGEPTLLNLAFAQAGLVAELQGSVWMLSLPHAATVSQ